MTRAWLVLAFVAGCDPIYEATFHVTDARTGAPIAGASIALVEGTYYLYVAPENPRGKGAEPDTVLARKRVARVWGLMAAAGVSDQKVVAVTSLPPAMSEGRKLPKAGNAKVEIIKMALVSSPRGYPPQVAVEFARKLLFSDVRPAFADLEQHLRGAR